MTSETIKHFDPLVPNQIEAPHIWLQKVFVFFLQSLFEHEEFRSTGMFWSRSEEESELIITGQKPRVEALNKRPHIVVIPGPFAWANLGFDQLQRKSMASGQRTHTDLISQTVAFHCQAKEGNFAQQLAWYASYHTIMFRRMLMRQGNLHHVAPNVQVSAETAPTAFTGQLTSEEIVSVVVQIPVYWQPQWTIRDPAPILQRFRVNLGVKQPTAPQSFGGRPVYRSIPIDEYVETPVTLNQETVVESD